MCNKLYCIYTLFQCLSVKVFFCVCEERKYSKLIIWFFSQGEKTHQDLLKNVVWPSARHSLVAILSEPITSLIRQHCVCAD